ncbi:alpha-D-ribose 1-methylphosphonate 5-triphosphate diphosphatase [Angulomicrobium tetraedrale]|uniref:Alpha-D-ribose 1-methylphosphonate 5-triphosphate diphosphatase n=1 Tax=Ancylobacter tetraedralis TaxID=217068 RepID=A0A839Z383_9HYPH|nr:alpha-D-ribose 1-methylphosphonate 5-triphosphate diphosphatase [Ancylobacter tetraedralis]MBB3769433.1 alpha-D-ribose 1-methylphosphonate 5-triphosphate diphosphatase [Ancylobacter tetraedralis]
MLDTCIEDRASSFATAPRWTLRNARLVTPEAVVDGALTVEEGRIAAIDTEDRAETETGLDLDLGGDYLLPGFVDVHTDNLEKHIVARPGVFWNPVAAVLAHDALTVAAGITTVFDSLVVGAMGKPDRLKALPMMIEGLDKARRRGLLRADHRLHLRCEVPRTDIVEVLTPFLDDPHLVFGTFMEDSAPRDRDRFRFVMGTRGVEDETRLVELEAESHADGAENLAARRRALVEAFASRGIACASHDDTRAWHIDEAQGLGMTIAEFPVTPEAMDAASSAGMTVIAGAPNVVFGRSHKGFLSMRERTVAGAVQILCSDYIPSSLLRAVFLLVEGGMALPEATALVSARPAETFGLTDRGALVPGRRADLIHVAVVDGEPVVRGAWTKGRRVF